MALVDHPNPRDRRIARLLVGAQFVMLVALALLPRRKDWPVAAPIRRSGNLAMVGGAAIAAVGSTSLGRGLTAMPLPNEAAQLRTGGLYRVVRHPIYTGLLVTATARAILLGNRWAVAVTAALVVLLNVKSRFEEGHLVARFPDYRGYANRTPRFVPDVRRCTPPGPVD